MTTPSASWLTPASGAAAASSLNVDWGQVAVATLFCVGLGVAAILVLRKRMSLGMPSGSASTRRIRVVEQTRIAPRATLHLVEYDRRVVMLVTDATGVKLLDAHDRQPPEH